MKIIGKAVCWGIDPRWSTLPIANLPAGARLIKRRIRSDGAAEAYVKDGNSIRLFYLSPFKDGVQTDGATFATATALWLEYERGRNTR